MKQISCTFVSGILLPTLLLLKPSSGNESSWEERHSSPVNFYHPSNLEKIILNWNESFAANRKPLGSAEFDNEDPSFADVMRRCFGEHQTAADFSRGKFIVQNCFKIAAMFRFLKYLTASPNYTVKLFNGVFEFVKTSDSMQCDDVDCGKKYNCHLDGYLMEKNSIGERNEYLYEEMVKNVGDESWKNLKDCEDGGEAPTNDVKKANGWWEAFRSVIIGDKIDRAEEEKFERQSLSMLNDLFRNYAMKINFYPGLSITMKRSPEGKFNFDVESESDNSDDGGWRDSEVGSEYSEGRRSRKNKISKGKKKKKFQKMLQKMLKHLMLPMMLQLFILPFFMKKLFLLAMKSLLAGKTALLLIAFNFLRFSRYQSEDQVVRVEHYGYRPGEEYGAWINGRSFGGNRKW